MKCSIKSDILLTAQKSAQNYSVEGAKEDTLTQSEVVNAVENTLDDIANENYEELSKDRNLLGKALRKIKALGEYGLIVPKENNLIYAAASKFFDNVMRHKDQAMDFINRLNPDGTYSSNGKQIIFKEKGVYKTYGDVEKINSAIKNYLGARLVVDETYVTKGKGNTINISNRFAEQYNDYRYNEYQVTIATIADQALKDDPNVTPEYKNNLSLLKATPIITHINFQISALNTKVKKMRQQSTFDAGKVKEIEASIESLKQQRKTASIRLSTADLYSYVNNILESIQNAFADPNTEFTPEILTVYKKALDLVETASNPDLRKNMVLEFSDMKKPGVFDTMLDFNRDAGVLKLELNKRIFSTLKDIVEKRLHREVTEEEFTTITGLSDSFSQSAQQILGLEHIGNPLITYIDIEVNKRESMANSMSRDQNDALDELYKVMRASNFDKTKFYQKDIEGHSNGRLTDVFTDKWWKNLRNIYKNRNRRRKEATTLNPRLLFSEDLTEEEKIEAKLLRKEIVANMGEYMGEMYLEEARRLWDSYNNTLDAYEKSVTGNWGQRLDKIELWKENNSPIYRIHNVNVTTKGHNTGSDRFLLLIPKKQDASNTDLGYYSKAYKDIENHKEAFEFYKETRKIFKINETALGNFENVLKPPTLAYIGNSVAELIKDGKYGLAAKLTWKNLKNEYGLYQKVNPADFAIDKITGNRSDQVTLEIHSIPQEVYQRVQKLLKLDEEYQELAEKPIHGKNDVDDMQTIYQRYYKQVNIEVEAERSEDLLQSVVMANYANRSFIEKKAIEAEMELAHYAVETFTDTDVSSKDRESKGKNIAKSAVNHFLNTMYYDVKDQDLPTALTTLTEEEKADPDFKAPTLRGGVNVLTSAARVLVLGWSFPHAILNAGQQYFSSLMKAIEGGYFNLAQLHSGYADIITKAKDRSIIDKLFIVGDVAYSYSKRTIHEQFKWIGRLHPMYFQTFMEKFNQGATSLAVMKKQMVTSEDTGEISLYDAIDDQGKLDEKFRHAEYGDTKGLELLVEITIDKIRPVVKQTAGDYLSPFLAEKNPFGKLALMFKKWLPEMVNDRFHKRTYNEALGREKIGRLRAFMSVIKLQALGRKDEIDKITKDAAIAGMAEIIIALTLRALYVLTARALCNTPECKGQRKQTLFALNMLGRLSDDVLSFVTPWNLIDNVFNPFAVEGAITDFYRFTDSLTSWIVPGGDDGLYKRKTDEHEKGDVKAWQKIKKITPGYKTLKFNMDKFSAKLNDRTVSAFIKEYDQAE